MDVNLKKAKKLHTIKGWGTSACWWSQACPKGETADKLAQLLYGDDGLRLNIYRYNIGGGTDKDNCRVSNPWRTTDSFLVYDRETEESHWDFSRDANAVNMMKKSLELGNIDTLILFANSPHYSLCSTGQASGSLLMHTCNIPKMNYKKFVDYILDVTQHFLDEGYPVKYVSPINEPQWKWGGSYVWQEGCHYETQEVVEIFRLFAEEIIKRDMPVRLYGPESGQYMGKTPEYLEALTADEKIMQVLDVFAVHSYHSDDRPEERYEFKKTCVDTHASLRFDMSEWCELPNKSHTRDFKGALITARIIGQDIVYSGCVSWTSWVAVNNTAINEDDGFDYADSLITSDFDFTNWYIAKRYYALAHFSKYVPVGSVALDFGFVPTQESNDYNVFAFETPDGSNVVVAVNEGNEQVLKINSAHSKMQIITSVSDDELRQVYNGTAKSSIEIPAYSITTVILE